MKPVKFPYHSNKVLKTSYIKYIIEFLLFVKHKFDFFYPINIIFWIYFFIYISMLQKAEDWIASAIKHLDIEYSKLQLGRANPALVEDITIEVYGSVWPIKNSASVSVMDSQTLNIKPWDKSVLHTIEKAISDSGIGLNPQNLGESIIIKIPPLTEERRKEIAKLAKKLAEDAKIWVRNARWESLKHIKKAEDDKEISEDESKDFQADLQKIIDEANKKIDEHYKNKEADIMKV